MSSPLYCRHFGAGPDPALMIHCGLGQSVMWKSICGPLSDQLTITAPDLPGHGRSPEWDFDQDVHDQACAALRPLFEGPRTHLVGHSFGATLALRLAIEDPSKVASLTLIEPVLFAAARGRPTHDAHRLAERHVFAALDKEGSLEAARRFNGLWGGGSDWDSLRPQVQADMAAKMNFILATEPILWDDIHGLLGPDRLERLQCPVTFIRGADTVPVIRDVHQGLIARVPHASENVIEGAGHMLVMSHAHEVSQIIKRVL